MHQGAGCAYRRKGTERYEKVRGRRLVAGASCYGQRVKSRDKRRGGLADGGGRKKPQEKRKKTQGSAKGRTRNDKTGCA